MNKISTDLHTNIFFFFPNTLPTFKTTIFFHFEQECPEKVQMTQKCPKKSIYVSNKFSINIFRWTYPKSRFSSGYNIIFNGVCIFALSKFESIWSRITRQVLLVCHKNKWRKLVTLLFFGGQEIIFIYIYFLCFGSNIGGNRIFFCPPLKTKTKKWQVFVTNHVTYFCDILTELAFQFQLGAIALFN